METTVTLLVVEVFEKILKIRLYSSGFLRLVRA